MKLAAAAALLALCLPTPAFATGGLLCRPAAGDGPALSLVIGHGIGGGIAGANLTEQGRMRSTFRREDGLAIGQSWIDRERVWLDLLDSDATQVELELRVNFQAGTRWPAAAGTLKLAGRSWKVSCEEG